MHFGNSSLISVAVLLSLISITVVQVQFSQALELIK